MNGKIPKVFANNNIKSNNNERYYKFNNNEVKKENNSLSNKSIYQKIREVFNSPNYVYKVDVIIETKDTTLTKKLIGYNKKYLITIDNELISISDIKDIRLS